MMRHTVSILIIHRQKEVVNNLLLPKNKLLYTSSKTTPEVQSIIFTQSMQPVADIIGEKCAVFGIFGKGMDVSRLTFFGLYALQHRGQESSGIATTDGKESFLHKDTGLVAQVFNEEIIKNLSGHIAVGHNRYSTSAGMGKEHAQPLASSTGNESGGIFLVHNGNLPSTKVLTDFLESKHHDYKSLADSSDSTLITEAIGVCMKEGNSLEEAIRAVYPMMTGSFSILIMSKEKLVAIRDSHGIRPLSIGKLNGGFVFASETCAFHPIGAEHIRDVLPGEMVIIDENGMRSEILAPNQQKLDIFEFVYFARPDSELLGKSVYEVRKNFGKQLAVEYKIDADVVIPVPETAIPCAIGYAEAAGLPFEMGLIKSRYIHRTFIEPEQHIRDQGVKLKLAPLVGIIKGKRVIIIDDSLVRGTTSRQIVKMLYEAGAKEVHFIISSPPVRFPDFYGIDLPDQSKLLAFNRSVCDMNEYLGSTSLNFLSYNGMIQATGIDESQFCTACFTGRYPLDILEKKNEVSYPTHISSEFSCKIKDQKEVAAEIGAEIITEPVAALV